MDDPIRIFFQRQGNSVFATDYRLSSLMLVVPLGLATYVDTYFSNALMFTFIYVLLSLASLILQKNVFQLKYAQCHSTLVLLIIASCLIWSAIVIGALLDVDDEVRNVVSTVIIIFAFVVKTIGVYLSYSSQYEQEK